MLYNCVIKEFPNGLKQFYFYDNPISFGTSSNNSLKENKDDINTSIDSLKSSRKRSMNNVYDLARCLNWDYFITLTINSKYCDRYDYSACCEIIKKFTRYCRRHNFRYLFVPEQHKDGAWHFHGLIQCDDKTIYSEMLSYSGHKDKGNPIYNINSFKEGFTTATKILDTKRTSSYISKYITKSFNVPKGKKRYWVSRNIDRPTTTSLYLEDSSLQLVINLSAAYSKNIVNQFNSLNFYEVEDLDHNFSNEKLKELLLKQYDIDFQRWQPNKVR